MKCLKTIAGLLGMAVGIGAILLALSVDRVFSSSGIFTWGGRQDRTFVLLLVALGFAVFLAAYEFTFRSPRRYPSRQPTPGVRLLARPVSVARRWLRSTLGILAVPRRH